MAVSPTTSAEIEAWKGNIFEISVMTSIGSCPAFNIRDGLVVTPSIKPVSKALEIVSASEQSRKIFMVLLRIIHNIYSNIKNPSRKGLGFKCLS
ncbi:hypothetical protein HOT69_gp066 [Cyanophage S-TIM4]|uniref:Uncharacterized protein n=1 Tax=Cyanophage S-TIM4 TaxID=1048189 RepID=A0A345AWQ4_9CAUD|nr:hypothetical protein HOT69_gp066 [Cyanophage S-TIM4]AXF41337.1 unknown [Cyanophage S-TIM4]